MTEDRVDETGVAEVAAVAGEAPAEEMTAEATQQESRPLGEMLFEKGILSEDQLRIALLEQEGSREQIGRILVRLGFVTEATIRDALSEVGDAKVIDLSNITIDPDVLARIPLDVAKQYNVFPVSFDPEQQRVQIAVANPNDFIRIDQIRAFLGGEIEVEVVVAEESEITRTVDEYYGLELTIEGILREIEEEEVSTDPKALQQGGAVNPVVRLVNGFLNDAVKRGASDIHFEPEESFLRVRYRIDGVMQQIRSLHRSYWQSMAVRLKVLSDMNIAESRLPQDGRIRFTVYGRNVDFRVACQPCTYGENFVLRLSDPQGGVADIAKLGLNEKSIDLLRLMMKRPAGVIMVTGPTGSGKTTTLYAIIRHLNKETVNIMTLEDPVEYPLPMIRQSMVGESSKMDWAQGIKSLLRQDPDIMLIGEVRESEVAILSFRAAMTGHMVLTTLHTNSAIGVIARLTDMGVAPAVLATNVSGIVAQRLVRRLCPSCKAERREMNEQEQLILPQAIADKSLLEGAVMYDPVGCADCEHRGYRGRVAVIELLRFNEDLDDLVAGGATVRDVLAKAVETNAFVSMAESGAEKVVLGDTTLDEIARVVDLTSFLAPVV
ncbi:MAG: GspE/PulE family protein [Gammaproteobacteria bacterium]